MLKDVCGETAFLHMQEEILSLEKKKIARSNHPIIIINKPLSTQLSIVISCIIDIASYKQLQKKKKKRNLI